MAKFSQSDGAVDLGRGLRGPAQIGLLHRLEDLGVDMHVRAVWDGTAYRVRHVEVDGHDVERATLERLPVRAAVAKAVLNAVGHDQVGDSPAAQAAAAYRVGLLVGEAPVQLVAERLNVSRATATRRIAEARAQGLLDEDERAPQGAAAARRASRLD